MCKVWRLHFVIQKPFISIPASRLIFCRSDLCALCSSWARLFFHDKVDHGYAVAHHGLLPYRPVPARKEKRLCRYGGVRRYRSARTRLFQPVAQRAAYPAPLSVCGDVQAVYISGFRVGVRKAYYTASAFGYKRKMRRQRFKPARSVVCTACPRFGLLFGIIFAADG